MGTTNPSTAVTSHIIGKKGGASTQNFSAAITINIKTALSLENDVIIELVCSKLDLESRHTLHIELPT